jgi:hypothetical protein
MPRGEAVTEALRTAVRLAHTPAPAEGLCGGFAAYEAWTARLRQPPEEPGLHGHAFAASILLTSRRAAATFLRRVAREAAARPAGYLREAAGCFARVARRLDGARPLMDFPWDLSWTPQNREREAALMERNLEDERAAIALIEQALPLLG